MSVAQVHFSDPDQPPGILRDLLSERVRAVPAGGSIDWVSYYFRDRRLAGDLVEARRRGVAVRLTLDGRPRTRRANAAAIRMLSGEAGLASGLHVIRSWKDHLPNRKWWRPRLHEKLYCFSHPEPTAIVGSFNPSGDLPEEAPAVLQEIGDHDRGFNLLAELCGAELVLALASHSRDLHAGRRASKPLASTHFRSGELELQLWPRPGATPISQLASRLSAGSKLRVAASHLSGPTAISALTALSARGVAVEMLTEETQRRVPSRVKNRLTRAGISIRRVRSGGLPMHDKFALVEEREGQSVLFGSFNWSEPSLRYNREISLLSRSPSLFETFAKRWDTLQQWT